MTKIPTIHTAVQVVWLANTSHILIDSAQNPRVMSTIAFRKMIKSQYALTDLLMFKDTNFNQMMVAESGRFYFHPLEWEELRTDKVSAKCMQYPAPHPFFPIW